MPLFYDIAGAHTSNGSGGTTSTHLWGKTAANQETLAIYGIYVSCRAGTAGGLTCRLMANSGTTASGGTNQVPLAKNLRYGVAAQSTWANDGTSITPGATLTERLIIGAAATGGQGGYVPITAQGAVQMQPNATNPVDVELVSIAANASVVFDASVEIGEGV
jgi:hypothetical protein